MKLSVARSAVVAIAAALLLAAPATVASAAPGGGAAAPIVPLAGCRAAPYSASFSLFFETAEYSDLGPYKTTSQCSDINLKSTNGTGYSACVIFIRHTTECNYITDVPAGGQWVNIATWVLDGTLFTVRVYKGGADFVTHAGLMDF
jgi:hypothetical protein